MYNSNVDPRQINYDPNQNQNFMNVNQGQDQMHSINMNNQQMMNQPMMNQPMQPMMNQPMMNQPMMNQHMQPMQNYNNSVNTMQQFVNPNQMMMQQQQQWRQQMMICNDPLVQLSFAKSARIEQQVELMEILTGCETANRYHVSIITHTGELIYLFKCKESSGWCSRNCIPSDSRPFNMKVRHVNSNADFLLDDYTNYWALLEKPYKCTCCCLGRPEMTAGTTSSYFGKIVEPCTCLDPLFHVMDSENNLKWQVHANYCQCGIACRKSPFGKCSEASFPIYAANRKDFDERTPDGMIKRLFSGLVQEMVSDADNFFLEFPVNATPQEKLMLIATVLMIDYRFFEDGPADDNNNSKRHHKHHGLI